jgi:hypothetical protein
MGLATGTLLTGCAAQVREPERCTTTATVQFAGKIMCPTEHTAESERICAQRVV